MNSVKRLSVLFVIINIISNTVLGDFWGSGAYGPLKYDSPPKSEISKSEISLVIITPFPIVTLNEADPQYRAAVAKAYQQATEVRKTLVDLCGKFNKKSKTIITPLFFTDAKNIKAFYDLLVDEMDKAEENDEDFEVDDFARDMIKRFRKETNNSTIQSIVFGVYLYKPEAAADAIELTFYDFQRDMCATDRAVIPKVAGRNRDRALQDLFTRLLKKAYD